MKRIVTLLLFVLLICVSCSSSKALVQANFEGQPVWYSIPRINMGPGKESFIGFGTGDSERQAELRAYENLYFNICEFLGTEKNDIQYRELMLSDGIEEYELRVTNKDTVRKNGTYTVYIRAKAQRVLIREILNASLVEMRENLAKIEKLVLEGDELIKEGKDLSGVSKYMQSMCLSFGNSQVEEEYSFDEIMAECIKIISSLSIAISDENSQDVTCSVSVTKEDGHFKSQVSSCPIRAEYYAVGVEGNIYRDSFTYHTDNTGRLSFQSPNYSILREGSVLFSFGLENEISELEKISGYDALSDLLSLLEKKTVSFDYNLVYTNEDVAIAVFDYDLNGQAVYGLSGNYYENKFRDSGFSVTVLDCPEPENDEEIVDLAESLSAGYLFISRIEVTRIFQTRSDGYAVTCDGAFSIRDLKNGVVLRESEPVSSAGFGDSVESAILEAFNNLADLFFSLVRSVYV